MRIAGELLAIALSIALTHAGAGQQLASTENVAKYRSMLPRTSDELLASIFENPRTIWYGDAEITPAYQHVSAYQRNVGVHDARYRIDGQMDPFGVGNANREWPWFQPSNPGGLRRDLASYKGLLLPEGKPIVWYSKPVVWTNGMVGDPRADKFAAPGLAWIYPIGTQIVEINTMKVSGRHVPWKVLHMQRRPDDWHRFRYLPFPTQESYEAAIGQKLELPGKSGQLTNRHPGKVFSVRSNYAELPRLEPAKTIELLTSTPFVECLETPWSSQARYVTARHDGQIVPRDSVEAFLTGGQEACQNCHSDTLTHVSFIENGRDWYGTVRGSDEVISFHPFGHVEWGANRYVIVTSSKLQQLGIAEPYNPAKHTAPHYGKPR